METFLTGAMLRSICLILTVMIVMIIMMIKKKLKAIMMIRIKIKTNSYNHKYQKAQELFITRPTTQIIETQK